MRAEKAGWGKTLAPRLRSRLACVILMPGYAAQAIELSVDANKRDQSRSRIAVVLDVGLIIDKAAALQRFPGAVALLLTLSPPPWASRSTTRTAEFKSRTG